MKPTREQATEVRVRGKAVGQVAVGMCEEYIEIDY